MNTLAILLLVLLGVALANYREYDDSAIYRMVDWVKEGVGSDLEAKMWELCRVRREHGFIILVPDKEANSVENFIINCRNFSTSCCISREKVCDELPVKMHWPYMIAEDDIDRIIVQLALSNIQLESLEYIDNYTVVTLKGLPNYT